MRTGSCCAMAVMLGKGDGPIHVPAADCGMRSVTAPTSGTGAHLQTVGAADSPGVCTSTFPKACLGHSDAYITPRQERGQEGYGKEAVASLQQGGIGLTALAT